MHAVDVEDDDDAGEEATRSKRWWCSGDGGDQRVECGKNGEDNLAQEEASSDAGAASGAARSQSRSGRGGSGGGGSAWRRSYGATGRRRGAQVAYPDPDRGSQREEWGAWGGVVVAAGGVVELSRQMSSS